MNPEVLYTTASRLATKIKVLGLVIDMKRRNGAHDRACQLEVEKQYIESKLRHLNHHIIATGA